jgi:hypothetical protein
MKGIKKASIIGFGLGFTLLVLGMLFGFNHWQNAQMFVVVGGFGVILFLLSFTILVFNKLIR